MPVKRNLKQMELSFRTLSMSNLSLQEHLDMTTEFKAFYLGFESKSSFARSDIIVFTPKFYKCHDNKQEESFFR